MFQELCNEINWLLVGTRHMHGTRTYTSESHCVLPSALPHARAWTRAPTQCVCECARRLIEIVFSIYTKNCDKRTPQSELIFFSLISVAFSALRVTIHMHCITFRCMKKSFTPLHIKCNAHEFFQYEICGCVFRSHSSRFLSSERKLELYMLAFIA